MIERSLAIKCPSIQYHLAGTKKVQQELAAPGVLQKFLKDPKKIDKVKNIFTGLYSMDVGLEGDVAFEKANKDPGNIFRVSCFVEAILETVFKPITHFLVLIFLNLDA